MPKRDPTDQLRRLQAVTDVALVHLELEELLTQLLLRVRDALEADTCAVLMLDGATDELVARAAIGIEEEVEQGVRIPVGGGFAGRVAATKEAVILPDVDHADVLNPILREKGIKSLLGVPLLISGDVLGVLHVGALQHREFDADDIELLQLVADRVALAIEHARAFEAERSARRRLEQIQSITDAAISQLALDALFSELLVRIHDILAVDTVAILLLDEHTMELVARAAVGIEEEVEQGVRIPFGGGFAGRVAATAAPVFLPRVDMTNVLNPILLDKGIKSLLGVPLIVSGRVTGVLHVGSLTPRLFDRDDTELLQLVAELVALAIERATLHEEMLELDALKLNFVAVASHELRTPATSVYGILATLRERGDSLAPELRHELEETLWSQTLRLRRLIEQLLDLSRLDADVIEIHPEPVALRAHVEQIVTAAATDPTAVQIDVPADAVAIVDRNVLDRVLTNLVTNAFRYGVPPIRVLAERTDHHLRLAVEDQGGGVSPEFVPDLFERFTRSEGSRAGASGTGLGLAIARSYARAHGGDLVYEEAQPHGARFRLVLPMTGT